MAVQEELTVLHWHHATEGPGEGGLAAAHRPDDGHELPGFDAEAQIDEGVPFRTLVTHRESAGF